MKTVLCINNLKSSKYFNGYVCWNEVDISEDSKSGLCWKCLAKAMGPVETPKNSISSGYPRGWNHMKQFVDSDGRVFRKGVEVPELKGTIPSTEIKKSSDNVQKKQTIDDKIEQKFKEKIAKKNGKEIKSSRTMYVKGKLIRIDEEKSNADRKVSVDNSNSPKSKKRKKKAE
jgi:hypothetical protein